MAHLAQVAREFRIGLKLLAAAFIVVTILFIFFKGGALVKNLFFPTPPPPPEQKFGELPKVPFPAQNPQKLEYRINTLTGKLPILPDRMKVYRMRKKEPSLVALKSAREKLGALGYKENETKISEQEYQWDNSAGQTIRMNILTGNFRIFSNFLAEEQRPLIGTVARKEGAYDLAQKLIISLYQETEDLDEDASTLIYLKVENGALTKVQSLNEANLARLDIFQKELDNYRIYYPGLSESLMYFVIKSKDNLPSIVETSFLHLTADSNNSSTYPIKTAEAALEDLRGGNALVFLDDKSANSIDITEVSLGYYIGNENQEYFLPIVVFQGKGFTAYVQAIAQ